MAPKSTLPVPLNETYYEPTAFKLPWVVVYRLRPEEIALNDCPNAKFGAMDGRRQTIAVFGSVSEAMIELSKKLISIRSFILVRE